MNSDETRLNSIASRMVSVLTHPAAFFRNMPKTGGFLDPLVFVVAIGIVNGLLVALKAFFIIGTGASFMVAIGSVVMIPIAAAMVSFVFAGILYLIWLLMGSKETFETAYRCNAFLATISPITIVLGFVPYLNIVGIAWGLYLVVTATVEVHRLPAKTAWLVFGFFSAIMALISVGGQYAARQMSTYPPELERLRNETGGRNYDRNSMDRLRRNMQQNQ